MPNANTYKALIATTLISSVVVFLGFTLRLKKQSKLASETFYELEPEPLKEENKEALEDILKSLDNLLNATNTNQAYNENNTDAEDEAFEQQLEAIRNRNNLENSEETSETTNESSSPKSNYNENEASAFNDINDIIAKTSEKKRKPTSGGTNKNSSISYSLVNRTKVEIPPPIYLCETGGKVVINIKVNNEGLVTNATYNDAASTTDNGCLVDTALEYAKASLFNADNSKASQLGTITFIFTRKR
jgi:hypothetical protein